MTLANKDLVGKPDLVKYAAVKMEVKLLQECNPTL